ncbi:MAG: GumC family protein [Cyclobacteriaceae bacterium]
MKEIYKEEEFIDIRKIRHLIFSKWWYFLLSLLLCLGLAIFYYKTSPKLYDVRASLQLKDQTLSDKGVGQEKFINGLELLAATSDLEDEINILSSFSLVRQTIEQLDFEVSYYTFPSELPMGTLLHEEIYQDAFQVKINDSLPQLVNVPIYISFPDSAHYLVKIEAEDAALFDISTQSLLQKNIHADVEMVLPLSQPFRGKLCSFELNLDEHFVVPEDRAYFFKIHSLQSLSETYKNKLSIAPLSEESNIVELKLEGSVPAKEEAFLNVLANTYIQNDLQKKNQLGLKAIEFIDSQLAGVYDSLQQVEGNLQQFRASRQIINVSKTSEELMQQMRLLEKEQAELKVQQGYFRHTSEYLKNNQEVAEVVAPSSVGISDRLLESLLVELADLSRNKIAKSYSSSNNNPVVRVLDDKIRNTKAALIENMDNLISSNSIALEENQRRIERLKQDFNLLPSSERNLIGIERQFALNDNIYNYLLEKRAEAGLALASNLPTKSLVDEARSVSSRPVSPNLKKILLLAFMAGMVLPLGFIWLHYHSNNKVIEKDDIEEVISFPLLGIIPVSSKDKGLAVANLPQSQIDEAFHFWRNALNRQFVLPAGTTRIIGITSSQQGDGKTFCAANLSVSYSRSRKKTLVISADLRKPKLYQYFGLKNIGMVEYLEQGAKLFEVIQPTQVKNLYFLGAGWLSGDLQSMLESDRMGQLFEELKAQFDVIIVDTPPIGLVADYYSLCPYFTQHVFVIRQGATDTQLLKGIYQRIKGYEDFSLVVNSAKSYMAQEYGLHTSHSYYYKAR